jgi:hypothetical protein
MLTAQSNGINDTDGDVASRLPYPVYFVHPSENRWLDVFGAPELPDPDSLHSRFVEANDIWIVQTYLRLKRRGLDVRLVSKLVPGAINVIMNYDLGIRQLSFQSYVVACRADTFVPTMCHQTIVQNPNNASSPTEHLVHHWPQPGLVTRDISRGARLDTVVYMGHAINLWSQFRSFTFKQTLSDVGVNFRINENSAHFSDYSQCDAVLAIRDLTEADFLAKPASKLVNAWHAGVPALLGPEPAFQSLRKTPFDYIEIRSTDEALRAIEYLKNHPDFFHQMIQNGFNRAQAFTSDRIAARWGELLGGPIAHGFSLWAQRPTIWKVLVRPSLFAGQVARNIYEKQKYLYQRDHGFRPVSGRFT